MGNKDSKPSATAKCLYCAFPLIKGTTQNAQKINICRRCGAPTQKSIAVDKAAARKGGSAQPIRRESDAPAPGLTGSGGAGYAALQPDIKTGDTKHSGGGGASSGGGGGGSSGGGVTAEVQLPLHRIYIRPFVEGMDDAAKALSDQQLLETVVIPYFRTHHTGDTVERGSRFQIKDVDYKVVSCYPPIGTITNHTRYNIGKPISALQQIKKIHILPSRASLPDTKMDAKVLFNDHLRPYFSGADPRHVCEGECFVSNGVEFKILACQPENGVVNKQTEIFADGEPLPDLLKLHMLPIYETLPNSQKQITPAQIFELYFAPYLEGRAQYLKRGDDRQIDGVDFVVVGTEPDTGGIATIETELYATGNPIRADELKAQQMASDEQIARDMQRAEARAQGYVFGGGGGMGMRRGMGLGAIRSPEELQARFQAVLAQMPESDPHRPIMVQLLHQLQLMSQAAAAGGGGGGGGNMQLLQMLRGMDTAHHNGATKNSIDALPTRIYKKRKPAAAAAASASASAPAPAASTSGTGGTAPAATTDTKSGGAAAAAAAAATDTKASSPTNADLNTCRVCLCEYEEGEELRTLPCFHSFHSACIDRWLATDKRCPMCKTAIQ